MSENKEPHRRRPTRKGLKLRHDGTDVADHWCQFCAYGRREDKIAMDWCCHSARMGETHR